MCSLMAFSSRIECHAYKNNLFDHWEQRSMILTLSRSNYSWLLCLQCWANKEFLSPMKWKLYCYFWSCIHSDPSILECNWLPDDCFPRLSHLFFSPDWSTMNVQPKLLGNVAMNFVFTLTMFFFQRVSTALHSVHEIYIRRNSTGEQVNYKHCMVCSGDQHFVSPFWGYVQPYVYHSRPQRPRSFWSAPRITTSGQSSEISVLICFANTIEWDWNQSDLSDVTLSMCRVTGSLWKADFWCWNQPEVTILGVDQKERGLWGLKCMCT